MNCECDFETANFNSDIYCKICGMDVDLNPIRKKDKGKVILYCCEGCIE